MCCLELWAFKEHIGLSLLCHCVRFSEWSLENQIFSFIQRIRSWDTGVHEQSHLPMPSFYMDSMLKVIQFLSYNSQSGGEGEEETWRQLSTIMWGSWHIATSGKYPVNGNVTVGLWMQLYKTEGRGWVTECWHCWRLGPDEALFHWHSPVPSKTLSTRPGLCLLDGYDHKKYLQTSPYVPGQGPIVPTWGLLPCVVRKRPRKVMW